MLTPRDVIHRPSAMFVKDLTISFIIRIISLNATTIFWLRAISSLGKKTSRPKIPVISLFVSAKDEFVDISAGINVFVGLRGITIPMAKTSVDARVYVR